LLCLRHGERQLVELTGELERHLIVGIVHRRSRVGADARAASYAAARRISSTNAGESLGVGEARAELRRVRADVADAHQ